MRFVIAAVVIFAFPAVRYAQSAPANEFVLRIQNDYRNAKNPDEVESITMYCKANISSLSFKQRDELSVQAIKLLEANKVDEANALFKRVNSLEELDDNLARMVCKPL
jgi:hypothetical protein